LTAIKKYNNTPQEIICSKMIEYFKKNRADKILRIMERTNIKSPTIYSWFKKGGNKPTFESVLEICDTLGIPFDDIPLADITDGTPQLSKDQICSVEGCGQPKLSKGLCSKHYQKMMRGKKKGV
jgi:transcriptional regulator with XRE-family HTH domain